jgi:protoporphyrinogen/coproporphyrinogen III oxidase
MSQTPNPPTKRIAVIGGGLAGLMAAKALEEKGADVCVLEGAARLGGVVQTTATEGYLHEQAASAFLAKPGGMLALCRELEVPVVKASPAARRRWIFLDGKRREVPSGPLSLLTTDLLTWRGKLDLLCEPLRPARRVEQAGDESVYDFAARRFGAQMARALVSPFVGGIFAADAHDVSLEAGFPQLAELDAAGGVLRGQLKKMFGGRKAAAGSATDQAPKLAKGERGLWAPGGGMAMVIQALASQLRSDVRLGSKVVELIPRNGAVEVVTEVNAGKATATTRERFSGVVVALPATDAAKLVPSLPEAGRRLGELARSPAAVVSLGYHLQDFHEIGLDGFGMLIANGEKARTLGIVFESVLWPGRAPADRVLLRCILGGARDPDAFALTDAQLIAAATEDVATTLGVRAAPVHALATRWAEGIAPFRVGHRQRVLEASTLLRSQRIALAGADYRGVGLNGICQDTPTVVAEAMAWS